MSVMGFMGLPDLEFQGSGFQASRPESCCSFQVWGFKSVNFNTTSNAANG